MSFWTVCVKQGKGSALLKLSQWFKWFCCSCFWFLKIPQEYFTTVLLALWGKWLSKPRLLGEPAQVSYKTSTGLNIQQRREGEVTTWDWGCILGNDPLQWSCLGAPELPIAQDLTLIINNFPHQKNKQTNKSHTWHPLTTMITAKAESHCDRPAKAAHAWSGGSDFDEKQNSWDTLYFPKVCLLQLLSARWSPPVSGGLSPGGLCELKASSQRPRGIPSYAGSREAWMLLAWPSAQLLPSLPSQPQMIKDNCTSRSACWKGTRLEGKYRSNEEMQFQWISQTTWILKLVRLWF